MTDLERARALEVLGMSKQYVCPRCGARYTHDGAYRHQAYLCPKRKQ